MKKILLICGIGLAIAPFAFARQVQLLQKNLLYDTNLISYWNFNSGTSTDWTGNTNLTAANATYGNQYGIFGQGLECNGTNTELIGTLPTTYNPITVTAWFNVSTGNNNYLFWTQNTNNVGFQVQTTGKIYVQAYNGSGGPYFTSATSTYADGKWHQIVIEVNGGTLTGWVDTVQIGTNSGATVNVGGTIQLCSSFGAANYAGGNLDDVQFWNRLLTASEISNLYTSRSLEGNGISR